MKQIQKMKQSTIIDNISSRLGISSLNEIQRQILTSTAQNILLLSPTGSGKTIAFAIGMLLKLDEKGQSPKAVVIAPSRELVTQIYDVIRQLATGMKVVAFYGGHAMIDEKKSLSITPDIIIATPGRLLDHINRKQIDLYSSQVLILDEYDKSLDLGFHDEMKRVCRTMPNLKRTILTSATRLNEMPTFLQFNQPEIIDALENASSVRNRTRIVRVESVLRDKLDSLSDLLHSIPNGRTIVFVNHRESAIRIYERMHQDKLPVGLYHGALDQFEREKAITLFDNGTTPILISTDLGARGLDIKAIESVIHYHIPPTEDAWVHRNGRTARVDAYGVVYVITSEADNIPEYINFDHSYSPSGHNDDPIHATMATLYVGAGKKEKLSRGDILGFLVKQGGLEPNSIGKISVKDHCILVAVEKSAIKGILPTIQKAKVKNKSVKISLLK